MYSVQRVYLYQHQQPAVLIDRLWPRGISKAQLSTVEWIKTIAPSSQLRQWLHQNPASRYSEFCHLYQQELCQPQQQQALQTLQQLHQQHQQLWLLTAAKDIAHSHIPVLLAQLQA
ncbi:DUF488 domain-containing protein [Snodgrassella alvi]|uniref:MarR family transcriptional regulator n=1 Tax=Snodgrassella alvi TaxID=1196083 RepID=A0A2N9WTR5_9NEIS|nr:DUF488 family protein [Snodgrassella alvi]PIT14086.1 hypothetical protein BGI33_08465 [Snodgrassella alvi]PIT15070.1 hypothetical protein BGI32_06090 [Snodgrassella alvi]PIT16098.1 hypothetical protein BGI34_10165 [Snodgrassella alvi]